MDPAEEIVLYTDEYGKLHGQLVELSEVDEMAKIRQEAVKFLGVYELDKEKVIACFIKNRTIFAKI